MPPFAVGWHKILSVEGELISWVGGQAQSISVSVKNADSSVLIEAETSGDVRLGYRGGNWRYDGNRILPTMGPGFRTVDYRSGPALTPASMVSWTTIPANEDQHIQWFSGQDSDWLRVGLSPAQILERIDGGLRPGDATHCLRSFDLFKGEDVGSPPDDLRAEHSTGFGSTIIQENGVASIWRFEVIRDVLGRYSVRTELVGGGAGSITCRQVVSGPTVVVGPLELAEERQRWNLSSYPVSGLFYHVEPRLFDGWLPESGWTTIGMFMDRVEGAAPISSPYAIELDGGTGKLIAITTSPDNDLAGLRPPVGL